MRKLNHTIRTAFMDLVQKVETAPRAGSVYSRERDGIQYLYAKVRVGAERIDRFVGRADDPEAEARASAYRLGTELATDRRRSVTLLKGAGLAGPDQILGATIDTIAEAGLFDKGATIVGTAAYLMSEALVGHILPAPTLMTEDLDVATADLTLSAEPPEAFLPILRRADPTFEAIYQLDARKPPSRFKTNSGFIVDLLTPTRRRSDENPMPLNKLAAGAAPLQYLSWLIADPVPTVGLWGPGLPVRVPQPARYAIHKLILAQKRNIGTRGKRHKDLAQAAALMKALEREDPYALEDALEDARAKGKQGWAEPIDRSLSEIARLGL
jgi:hypothetical protein